MDKVSVCVTLKNRAHLFKHCLEGLARQDFNGQIEICVLDDNSKDNLLSIIDRYSDNFVFRYATMDSNLSWVPSKNPAPWLNLLLHYLPTNDFLIKTDPEVVMLDSWIVQEVVDNLKKDDTRMYNSRCHFTDSDGWYMSFNDIINSYQQHYHQAEGGPFSRSKFYFCSGMSKKRFDDIGGIDELFSYGVGYEDNCFREMWKNRYGNYEHEITGQTLHLFHGHSSKRSTWEIANGRSFNYLKKLSEANTIYLKAGELSAGPRRPFYATPLSKVYTITDGSISNVDDFNDGKSKELDLPF
jgi:glycosyltransferase involved in cell wall biosynthesis